MTEYESVTSPCPPIILVDGSSYLFRAYHALPPLNTSSGEPTGAIKGVVSMLRKLINTYHPIEMLVVFDAKGKTFRHERYPMYKAHRPPMPEDLAQQIGPLQELVRAMGLPLAIVSGVEADDVIGTVARKASAQGRQVLISTGDKDMAQLVGEQVTLINTMTSEQLDVNGVEQKFGVPPEQIIDYLALLGDKSDNVPGLPGVGEKSARLLLSHFQDIEHLLNARDEATTLGIRGGKRLPEKLEAHELQLRLSKELVTIKCDVELDGFDLSDMGQGCRDLALQPPRLSQLKQFFQDLEFKTWLEELEQEGCQGETSLQDKQGRRQYETVVTQEAFDQWCQRLSQSEIFAVDTETTSLDYMSAELVGFSFALIDGAACYIPVGHTGPEPIEQLDREQVIEALRPILENSAIDKVGQNLKYDMSVLARYGVALRGVAFDTMLESYVWNATATRHDMDSLATRYLDRETVKFEHIAGKGAKQITFDQVPLDQAAFYAAEDAEVTLQLHQFFFPKLQEAQNLLEVFEQIEMPLVPVLSNIERKGALLDVQALEKQSAHLAGRLAELQASIFEMAGVEFNVDSTKQLGEILFDKLQLPIVKKTPKGAPSTAEPVLQELAHSYPLPKLLLEYRSLSKLKSTYTDKLPLLVHGQTHRVHTSYHQAVTATGRLSSSDPNLQNIPIRTEEGRKVRHAFIAPAGNVLVACDYSQIELRIMAHLSEDDRLLSAFSEGADIHRATAAEVFGVDVDDVTDGQRRDAKAINFGLIYGMSAFGLARQLGIGRQDAQAYIDAYFARYPGVRRYMEDTRLQARELGYVQTHFGRRLYLPQLQSRNKMQQQAAERTAINAPMQGTAADIIKLAMIKVSDWLLSSGLNSAMILQVHDELVLEVPEAEVDEIIKTVPSLMGEVANLSVPLIVDHGMGQHWAQAH